MARKIISSITTLLPYHLKSRGAQSLVLRPFSGTQFKCVAQEPREQIRPDVVEYNSVWVEHTLADVKDVLTAFI